MLCNIFLFKYIILLYLKKHLFINKCFSITIWNFAVLLINFLFRKGAFKK